MLIPARVAAAAVHLRADVFVIEHNGDFVISDYGESLGWLRLQSLNERRSSTQNRMIRDVCQTAGLEIEQGQLELRTTCGAPLGEAVQQLAQGAAKVADLLRNGDLVDREESSGRLRPSEAIDDRPDQRPRMAV